MSEGDQQPTLRFLGHAAFSLTWHGLRVCLDPHKPGALGGRFSLPAIEGPFDHVIVTHLHEDHAAWTPALGTPRWHDGDGTLGPLRLRTRAAFHDAAGGTRMGLVRMVSLDDGQTRVVHAGDIGAWDNDDIAWLRGDVASPDDATLPPTDVLLVPAGGTYTLDGAGAAAFAKAAAPRVVIPMHAGDPRVDLPLEPIERFFAAWGGAQISCVAATWRPPPRAAGSADNTPRALLLPPP